MQTLIKLRDYYDKNCKPLVFVGEKQLSSFSNCKMYFFDVSEDIELKNYKKLFQEYLVFYIRNRDHLESVNRIKSAITDQEISDSLLYESKRVRLDKGLYPQIDWDKAGIYGELFNDFYLNVVKKEEVISTYVMRTSYNVPNAKGVDLVSAKIEDNNLIFIFSESKFVSSAYKAKSSLCEDIVGTPEQLGHVTEDYINSYTSFLMNNNHSIYFDRVNCNLIMNKINEVNDLILNYDMKPIDALNKLNIKIRFDFFAIYADTIFDVEKRKKYFMEIVDSFNLNISNTGIHYYDIEVIFIPTRNSAANVKGEMEKWN